jgi:hypothetical protein
MAPQECPAIKVAADRRYGFADARCSREGSEVAVVNEEKELISE